MPLRLAVVLALAVLAAPAPAGARTNRIVGGVPAGIESMPYTAGVQIALQGVGGDEPDALCGGSLVAARWVVTAAHCLVEEPVDVAHSYVVLGATNLNTATAAQRFPFANGYVPNQYATGNGGYDLGLIKLARPAPGPQVRLPRASETGLLSAGRPAVTAGWGLTEDKEDGGSLSTGQFRQVDLSLYSNADCSRAFAAAGQRGLDFSTEICALNTGKDSCNGDSGGPLVVDDGTGLPALIGAVSFGIGSGNPARGSRSCNEGPPGVYSRLGANPLNGFIREKVPLVDLSANVRVPVPGEKVTVTADPDAPGGTGPFGGYDTLAWDLDGDGAFTEAVGSRTAQVTAGTGITSVAVHATTTAGDAETRTLRLFSQNKSALSFAQRTARVRRGRSIRLKIRRVGIGAGSARIKVSGFGISASPRRVRVNGSERAVRVRIHARRWASRRVSVRLRAFRGDAVGGTLTTLRLRTHR